LDRAIRAVGSLTAFARRVGVSPQVVANWRKRGNIPPDRVLAIEAATVDKNGRPRVLRHDLRPDLYPEDRAA
jgi:DNA-binding transcriptional regulator YdaS (Cro superfamily)